MNMRVFPLAVCLGLASTTTILGSTWYASPSGAADADCLTPETAGTIQAAIDAASAAEARSSWAEADSVLLLPGTYHLEDGSRGRRDTSLSNAGTYTNLVVSKRDFLEIRSASGNPSDTVLLGGRGRSTARCFLLKGQVRLSGITLTNFFSGNGAAVLCWDQKPVVSNCIVSGNCMESKTYGSIYSGTVRNCVFLLNGLKDNNRSGGGTAYSAVYDSAFTNNFARQGGAGIGGTFENCIFYYNYSKSLAGGAIANARAVNCRFEKNYGYGGAAVSGGYSTNCVFTGNTSNPAIYGGVAVDCVFTANTAGAAKDAVLVDCLIEGNTGEKIPGGVQGGTTTNCVFRNNRLTNPYNYGGGAARDGTHVNALFERNACVNQNGGAALSGGTAINCRFIANRANRGSGAYNATIIDSVFEKNVSLAGGTIQGGSAQRCRISGNVATNGAVLSSCKFVNCLIDGNATGGASGGSIVANAVLINCTIANNKPLAGKGGLVSSAATNTLFHTNGAFDLGDGATARNCLYATTAGTVVIEGGIVCESPLFKGEQKAPEAPYSLRGRSPAVDAGCMEVATLVGPTDIYGRKRLNGTIDIGCSEHWPSKDGTRILIR